ncbi:hypothetical protein [Luteibacter sp. CQ10]|uniref:hypothetical protein n=1 Tax=Luteibacter sp. CQ10 TaxID=2805821 RepID=UPI0034A19CFB
MGNNEPPGLLGRLRERLTTRPCVRFDPVEGTIVHVSGPLSVRELPVASVRRVEAGNRDDASYDTVFLFFHADDDLLAVSEHDKGFDALVDALGSVFPGIDGWQAAVPPVKYQLTSVDLWVRG